MNELLSEIRDLLAAIASRESSAGIAPKFLDVDSAAAYTSLSVESIRRLLSANRLQALRPVRGRIVIDREQLESYVRGATNTLRTGRGRRKSA